VRAIFISYRRQDSEGEAGRLFDDLVAHFGERSVFMDVETIEVGRDFRKAINANVAGCGVLLAIIGPAWLGARDESGQRRLDDANDFVRLETAAALHRDIPVIPVLVRAAKLPKAEHLPPDLADLAYRNAVELTHARWKSDIQSLVRALRSSLSISTDGRDAVARNSTALDSIAGAQFATPSSVEQIGGLDSASLARVARELAHYIGPVAELVVRRAAERCASMSDLRLSVSEEIEVLADRARFLDANRER
jgi:hypothetical protein